MTLPLPLGRTGDRRWLAVIGSVVLAGAGLILWLGRGASFFHDEWYYICGRALSDPGSWLLPHNEHLVLLHVIAYRALVEAFGLGSYLPFQIALVLTHVAVVGGVYALVSRHAGRWPAAGAAAVMLVLGSGYTNLFWAFQIGFVGATALGLWALVALPERPRLATLLLIAAVATQGVGLFFIAAAGVYLIVAGRVRSIGWLAVPAATYGAWALLLRSSIDVRGQIDVVGMPRFAARGVIAAAAGTMGIPTVGAAVAAAALVASRPTAWKSPLVVGCAAGLLAEFALIGLVRQGFGAPNAPHYIYVGAAFLLPIAATLLASARLRWVGVVLLVIAFSANLNLLIRHGLTWKAETDALRAKGSDVVPPGVCRPTPAMNNQQPGLS